MPSEHSHDFKVGALVTIQGRAQQPRSSHEADERTTTFFLFVFLALALSLASAINDIRPLAIVGFAMIFVSIAAGVTAAMGAPAIGA